MLLDVVTSELLTKKPTQFGSSTPGRSAPWPAAVSSRARCRRARPETERPGGRVRSWSLGSAPAPHDRDRAHATGKRASPPTAANRTCAARPPGLCPGAPRHERHAPCPPATRRGCRAHSCCTGQTAPGPWRAPAWSCRCSWPGRRSSHDSPPTQVVDHDAPLTRRPMRRSHREPSRRGSRTAHEQASESWQSALRRSLGHPG